MDTPRPGISDVDHKISGYRPLQVDVPLLAVRVLSAAVDPRHVLAQQSCETQGIARGEERRIRSHTIDGRRPVRPGRKTGGRNRAIESVTGRRSGEDPISSTKNSLRVQGISNAEAWNESFLVRIVLAARKSAYSREGHAAAQVETADLEW